MIEKKTPKEEIKLTGVPASPGIAIGTALVLGTLVDNIEKKSILFEEVEDELNRFEEAIDITKKQIFAIQKQVQKELNDDQARIFDAHLLILDDHILINSVKEEVKKELINVEYVFNNKIQFYIKAISKIEDPYIRERGADIRDVGSRVIANLHGHDIESLKHLPGQRIIVSPDLTPSDTVSLDRENVQAFATATGSRTSHAAIMARSMKIPAVLAIKQPISQIKTGNIVIIDGYAGIITVNPSAKSLNFYAQKETRGGKIRENLIKESNLRPETIDGFRVQLAANIEFIDDISDAKKYRAAGIGLYRTEYLYINSKELPDEEVQFNNYKDITVKMKGSHVVIRTLDIGGDKLKDNLSLNYEDNPFLGYRAIRLSLGFPELMKTQLRAILRASAYGNIKIMFPMISCMEELDKTLEILNTVKADLKKRKIPFNNDLEIGTMIETPSAALIADKLAEKVDFFSIGTNDLVQYTLAVDRNSEKVAYLYQPSHPAILALIRNITDVAKRNGIWVSVCGEMAGDPQYTPLLLGMGVHELSMSPVSMGLIRSIIRNTRMFEVENIAENALECSTAKCALKLSLDYLKKIEPDIYNLSIKGE
ncbi:MAG TPA: phosphoenolpyruvate--protein phosphotransferase [Victivallales bacterium]|nr:phosphoenolpyruvate--protein phosphotransferase [Victivallales bacterium]